LPLLLHIDSLSPGDGFRIPPSLVFVVPQRERGTRQKHQHEQKHSYFLQRTRTGFPTPPVNIDDHRRSDSREYGLQQKWHEQDGPPRLNEKWGAARVMNHAATSAAVRDEHQRHKHRKANRQQRAPHSDST
jgi:hypothetical protein